MTSDERKARDAEAALAPSIHWLKFWRWPCARTMCRRWVHERGSVRTGGYVHEVTCRDCKHLLAYTPPHGTVPHRRTQSRR